MSSCIVCGGAFINGEEKKTLLALCEQNLDDMGMRDRTHVVHESCSERFGREIKCPECVRACVICKSHVSHRHNWSLCECPDHRFHEVCVNTQKLTKCPACAKRARDERLAAPCIICGERLIGITWSTDCDRMHGMHPRCALPWDNDRIVGCLGCEQAQPMCPACGEIANHEHRLQKCHICGAVLIDHLMGSHICDSSCKLCFACGHYHQRPGSCSPTLESLMPWDRTRHRFVFACPLCPAVVPNLTDHFANGHGLSECDICGAGVDIVKAYVHAEMCDGASPCPASECKKIISKKTRDASITNANVLWEDHKCRNLYPCATCGSRFYSDSDLSTHSRRRSCTGTITKKRIRRAAFIKSSKIVLALAQRGFN